MNKKMNIVLVTIVFLSVIIHFLITQTNFFSSVLGLNLNKTQVLVAKQYIEQGEIVTQDKVTEKYIDSSLLLVNPRDAKDVKFVKKSKTELTETFVATSNIVPGEQIANNKVESKTNSDNPKKLMYAITVDYLSTVGSSLYVGDKPMLWHSWSDKQGETAKNTEKVFNIPVEILSLKNSEGFVVNADRTKPSVIPSVAVIRVDEQDVVKLEQCLSQQSNKFFFVKQIPQN